MAMARSGLPHRARRSNLLHVVPNEPCVALDEFSILVRRISPRLKPVLKLEAGRFDLTVFISSHRQPSGRPASGQRDVVDTFLILPVGVRFDALPSVVLVVDTVLTLALVRLRVAFGYGREV